MPRQAKGVTVPSQFRLKFDTLADLDAIAEYLSELTGLEASRTDAIRYAARHFLASLARKNNPKKKPPAP